MVWTEQGRAACAQWSGVYPDLAALVGALLARDPRPAYRRDEDDGRVYGMRVYDLDVRWRAGEGWARVVELARIEDGSD